jgi:hypothetical protein
MGMGIVMCWLNGACTKWRQMVLMLKIYSAWPVESCTCISTVTKYSTIKWQQKEHFKCHYLEGDALQIVMCSSAVDKTDINTKYKLFSLYFFMH